jgi:hypothetical protein
MHRTLLLGLTLVLLAFPVSAIADDLEVAVVNGNLKIRGDADDNILRIDDDGFAVSELRITPGGTTTVNGSSDPLIASGITGDVDLALGSGANQATLSSCTSPASFGSRRAAATTR